MNSNPDKPEWVLLFTADDQNRTAGPVSKNDVLTMIASGEVSYSDKIWRSPEKSWSRIGDREEFHRRANAGGEVVEVNFRLKALDFKESETQEELLGNVLRFDKAAAIANLIGAQDEMPDEASGEDLTGLPREL